MKKFLILLVVVLVTGAIFPSCQRNPPSLVDNSYSRSSNEVDFVQDSASTRETSGETVSSSQQLPDPGVSLGIDGTLAEENYELDDGSVVDIYQYRYSLVGNHRSLTLFEWLLTKYGFEWEKETDDDGTVIYAIIGEDGFAFLINQYDRIFHVLTLYVPKEMSFKLGWPELKEDTFQNDIYVDSDDLWKPDGGGTTGPTKCQACNGSGKCLGCGGDGISYSPYLGVEGPDNRYPCTVCDNQDGVCTVCSGTGYWD